MAARLLTTAATAALAALLTLTPTASAADNSKKLTYEVVNPNSKASAMMMGLINEDFVFILDKVEGNTARLANNKPVWGSIFNIKDNTVTSIDVNTNAFCASGLVLGNGTWVVAGGNNAISYGGSAIAEGSNPDQQPYQDHDGRKALRLLQPIDSGSSVDSIQWLDTPGQLEMLSQRWYPGVESLADGSMVLIGGATNGGYINRNFPNTDPLYSGSAGASLQNMNGGSNPSFEFFPNQGKGLQLSKFMGNTSGLNMYPHMFLLPSGNIFMQANYSTVIWDYNNNQEQYLQDMPGQIVRVYPASGATAMLPLTPANKYTPTILFCGGFYADPDQWGDFTAPYFNPLTSPSSSDCHSITPSNEDGSDNNDAQYVKEQDLPEGRTMGQFIHLPTGQMMIVNGASKGTAGYGNVTSGTQLNNGHVFNWSNAFNDSTLSNSPIYTETMSQDPTYTPVMYDPEKPMGSRLTRAGFGSSTIARLYHSSAVLLPDGSILIGGSNPHMDVAQNLPKMVQGVQTFPTTYELERWYPDYFFEDRPMPANLPGYILYGGDTWSFKMDAKFMGSSANYKAQNTKIMVIRPGFSTHAMNMGQRSLQLQHSYTVNGDGTVDFTVMPMPKNPNLFAPGPALLFVTIDGIPSPGKYVMIGQKQSGGAIPMNYAAAAGNEPSLPQSVNNTNFNAIPEGKDGSSFGIGKIVGIAVGAAALIALILLGLLCWRRQSNKRSAKGGAVAGGMGDGAGAVYGQSNYRDTPGGEYKRVNTPASSVHAFGAGTPGGGAAMSGHGTRGSLATYDSYRMNDVSGPNTPYYDSPRQNARSPLGHGGGDYSSQGWGEHHGGDAGDYYHDNMDRSQGGGAAQYYDSGSQGYGSRR
ncbi:unnamed protein product [Sympodiomycopsis kandeliae]